MLKLNNFLLIAFLLFNLFSAKAMERFNELEIGDVSRPSLGLTQREALEGIDKVEILLNSPSTLTPVTYPLGQQTNSLPYGYISTDTDCKNIYITYRGTLGFDGIYPSLIRKTVELNSFQPFQSFSGHINASYFSIFQNLVPEIDSNLKSILAEKSEELSQLENVWCIGYSVGGGYAQLSAAYLAVKLKELVPTTSPSLKILTYAAPYLFDSEGKNCFSQMDSISLNVNFVANEDLIAKHLRSYNFGNGSNKEDLIVEELRSYNFENGSNKEVSFPASFAPTYSQRVEGREFTGMIPAVAFFLKKPIFSTFTKAAADDMRLPSQFLEPECWEAHALMNYKEAISTQWQSLEKSLNSTSL